ncbi:hypothetical protein DSM19430T_28330 [Desulfovibrio psychrotolerans]|uniref:Uncharacterized protein n=1 Tax=Desulfovibrio psychrotolerans TaxID=415242 RepID=A0A7J0BWQ4_9BACT|nr:hypothetical protein DSM19430T_28330 [Desulfovibrio psychrotolerans]
MGQGKQNAAPVFVRGTPNAAPGGVLCRAGQAVCPAYPFCRYIWSAKGVLDGGAACVYQSAV